MSQFQGPFDDQPAGPRKTSALAIASLISSLTCVCAPIGALLGLIALATLGEKKGKGLAIAGLLLGIVISVVGGYGAVWSYGKVKPMIEFAMTGPDAALSAGFSGDVAGFKASFYGAGASASDAEATAFIEALRQRYGDFTSARIDESAGQAGPKPGQTTAVMPYVLTFANESVSGETELVFADKSTGKVVLKLGHITVIDADAGDLTYPADGG